MAKRLIRIDDNIYNQLKINLNHKSLEMKGVVKHWSEKLVGLFVLSKLYPAYRAIRGVQYFNLGNSTVESHSMLIEKI
jgi:hypothetical protein